MRIGAYDVFADYHTHTCFSHGKGTVLENARAAKERGIEVVAISDHGPANLFGVGVETLDTFDEIHKEVLQARAQYPEVNVLLGVEANVISEDGGLDVPKGLQERFDVVLVGLHPLVRWRHPGRGVGLIGQNVVGGWTKVWRDAARERNTNAIVNAVLGNRVHAVTHPGYRLPIDTRALARACARAGCVMEINAGHEHTTVEYIQVARSEGARFVLGSDAHSPGRVGDLARAAELARAAGLEAEEIVNVRPLAGDSKMGAEQMAKGRERV